MPMRDCKRHEAAKVNEIGEGFVFAGRWRVVLRSVWSCLRTG